MYIANKRIKPGFLTAATALQPCSTSSTCRCLTSQHAANPRNPGANNSNPNIRSAKADPKKALGGELWQKPLDSKTPRMSGVLAQYKEGFTFRKTGVKAVPIRKHKVDPIVPVRKVKIGEWKPLVRIVEAESIHGEKGFKDEAKPSSLSRWDEGRGVEAARMEEYNTTLLSSRIFDEAFTDLTPEIFHDMAVKLDTPLLMRPPHPASPSLPQLAASSAMPAIEKWFSHNPSSNVSYEPFNLQYFSQFTATMLPYELLTPIIPTQNDGTHDVLSEWAAYNALSMSHFLPSSPPLSTILSQCLARAVSLGYEPALKVANNPALSSSFSTLIPGIPLSILQWELLQKHGHLFQTFHIFSAPLGLLIAAASNSEGSAPSLPGLYVAQAQLPDLPRELQNDLPLPFVLQHLHQRTHGRGADIYGSSIWLGTPPTFTPLHRDPNPNLFIQLHGRKALRLIPPSDGARLFRDIQNRISGQSSRGTIRGSEMMEGLEKAELRREVWGDAKGDAKDSGGGRGGKGEVVVLRPGDALFVPKGWWHSVMSLESELNASVNWWFR